METDKLMQKLQWMAKVTLTKTSQKILTEAVRKLDLLRWRNPDGELPADPDEGVLARINGRADGVAFQDALVIAFFDPRENEWILEQWHEAQEGEFWVDAWRPLGDEEEQHDAETILQKIH